MIFADTALIFTICFIPNTNIAWSASINIVHYIQQEFTLQNSEALFKRSLIYPSIPPFPDLSCPALTSLPLSYFSFLSPVLNAGLKMVDSQYYLPNDIGISALDCGEAFRLLSPQEKMYAHYLSRAAWYVTRSSQVRWKSRIKWKSVWD